MVEVDIGWGGFRGFRRDIGFLGVFFFLLLVVRFEGGCFCYLGCCIRRVLLVCRRRFLCTLVFWWRREFWGYKCRFGFVLVFRGFVLYLGVVGFIIDFCYMRL